jgi:hypothetical protein
MRRNEDSTAERLVVAAHFLTPSSQGASTVPRCDLSDLWQHHERFSHSLLSAAVRDTSQKAESPHGNEHQLARGSILAYVVLDPDRLLGRTMPSRFSNCSGTGDNGSRQCFAMVASQNAMLEAVKRIFAYSNIPPPAKLSRRFKVFKI